MKCGCPATPQKPPAAMVATMLAKLRTRGAVYADGEIVFEMYDAQTGKLVWKGGDRKNFTLSEDVEGIIQTAIKKIFKKFPVKHKN